MGSIRRLASRGWSAVSIARAYDLDVADVRRVLGDGRPPAKPSQAGPIPARPDPARRILGHLAAAVRRRHLAGDAPPAIAEALGLDPAGVESFIARIGPATRVRPILPPPDPSRPIRGILASSARRRHLAGQDAPAIAEALGLEPAAVAEFIDRITPVRGASLARPRTRREQMALRPRPTSPRPVRPGDEWRGPPAHLDDADGLVKPSIAAELPGAEDLDGQGVAGQGVHTAAEILPAIASAAAEEWGPMQETWPRGERAGAARLTDDDARRMRTLRAEGLTRRELADQFMTSMATVGRILAGRSYRDAMPSADVDEAPPAIAEAPGSPAPCPSQVPPGDQWGPRDKAHLER